MSSENGLRYFNAIYENKKKQEQLREKEFKIDDLQKRMLSKYWKEKFDAFDDLIKINVKTPSYSGKKDGKSADDKDGTSIHLGEITIDAKLLSGKPVSLQRGPRKGATTGPGRMTPVISIEGTGAVCYPNKEAKKGRKVELKPSTLRRMEQCKTLSDNLDNLSIQKTCRPKSTGPLNLNRIQRAGSPMRRPMTAPGRASKKGTKSSANSRATSSSPTRPKSGVHPSGKSRPKKRPSTTSTLMRRTSTVL